MQFAIDYYKDIKMNEELAHVERVRQAILKEEIDTCCEFLGLADRIIYCEKIGKGKTAPCVLDSHSARYVAREFCELKGREDGL